MGCPLRRNSKQRVQQLRHRYLLGGGFFKDPAIKQTTPKFEETPDFPDAAVQNSPLKRNRASRCPRCLDRLSGQRILPVPKYRPPSATFQGNCFGHESINRAAFIHTRSHLSVLLVFLRINLAIFRRLCRRFHDR